MKAVILAAGSGERWKASGVTTPKPLIQLGGLSLLERAARTALKAGVSEVLIVLGSEAATIQKTLEPRLAAQPVRWIVNPQWAQGNGTSVLAAGPSVGGDPFLVLMADHLVFAATLKRAMAQALEKGGTMMAVDFKKGLLIDPDDATKVCVHNGRISDIGKQLTTFDAFDTGISVCTKEFLDALQEASTAQNGRCAHTDGMKKLASQGRLFYGDIEGDLWEDSDSPESLKASERVLLQSLRKSTDGFMSKHLERFLSGAITRLLYRTSITPNQMTVFVIGVGALAAWFFAQTGYWPKVIGALLFWCSSFMDGCDGELARLKFMESRLGGWLDLWADNLVHMMVFTAMGVGLWRDTQESFLLWLGAIAALGVFFSVSWVSWTTVRHKKSQGPLFTSVVQESTAPSSPWAERLRGLADALSRRDFIFGVIFIALLEWLEPFLWAAAIGSHAYWMVLLAIARAR